jgi:hypothetical protein
MTKRAQRLFLAMCSAPDIFLGATFRMQVYPYHYCVIISEYSPDDEVVLVRLTEMSESWEDHCLLTTKDYSHLDKLTVPAYAGAGAGKAVNFQNLVDLGKMNVVEQISQECLNKILEGAKTSEEIPRYCRPLLPQN